MEVMLLGSFLNTYLPKIWVKMTNGDQKKKSLEKILDMDYLRQELSTLGATIQGCESPGMEDMDSGKTTWISESRRLAQEIEDHIEIILHQGVLDLKISGDIKKKTDNLIKRLTSIMQHQPTTSTTTSASKVDQKIPDLPEHIEHKEGPRDELLELVLEDDQDHTEAEKMKVIAIVGFDGLGKTLRANQVYRSAEVKKEFNRRVWVCAGGMSADNILMEIWKKLGEDDASSSAAGQQDITDMERIKTRLQYTRYFIVIDDLREPEQWHQIKGAFPRKLSSRIIVTTAIQYVAQTCCCSAGYVYKLLPLGEGHSVNLLVKELSSTPPEDAAKHAKELLKICEGLPLALCSLSEYFQSHSDGLTRQTGDDTYRELGAYLMGQRRGLKRIREVLVGIYTALDHPGERKTNGLDRHILKACLLYFSMFLDNHQTTRNHLIRRWIAEGFSSEGDAIEHFKTLTERSVIQVMEVSSNGHAKRCQPPGMMHKYIFCKATSENFVTEPPAENKTNGFTNGFKASEYSHVRRLCVNLSQKDGKWPERMDLSFVRAVQVSGKATKPIFKFGDGTGNNYKLLRVLELKDYTNLTSEEVANICDHLLLLRYLSLGKSINQIPEKIKKLTLLETLHMRRTRGVIVPFELFLLPSLTHLLGKFQFYDEQEFEKITSPSKIKLERLSGFVAGKKGFPELVPHMKRLRKVKIWCNGIADGTLSEAIKKFIRKGSNTTKDQRSLSVDFLGCSTPFKDSDKYRGRLSSLKLKGKMEQFPQSFLQLSAVLKLCLSSTELTWVLIEEGVGQLRELIYLKIYEDNLHDLAPAQEDGATKDAPSVKKVKPFQKLQRICLSAKTRLPPPTFLQCLHYLAGIKQVNLYCIQTLDEQCRCRWKEAARKHPRRPMVWFGAPPQASQ